MSKQTPLTITKGSTFVKKFYWYDGDTITVPITAITLAFPPVLTAVAHGLPTEDCPARLLSIEGPDALNTNADDANDRRFVRKVGVDTLKVPDFNASGLDAYIGHGYLAYVAPKSLAGMKARMQLRKTFSSDTILFSLTTENSRIALTAAEGLTVVTITAAESDLFDFKAGVYDLEMVVPGLTAATDVVVKTFKGPFTIEPQVTR